MSTSAQSQVETRRLESARQQIDMLVKKLAQLAEQDLAPADFYGPFLQAVLETLAAPAGVVWERSAQGNLMLQYQVNLHLAGFEDEERRRTHDELLRRALTQGRPMHVLPHSQAGGENGESGGGNPTDYLLLMAPMKVDQEITGVLEIWQRPNYLPQAVPGFMQFLTAMAELASVYYRNRQRRRMMGQEQLWQQIEAFDLQVQASLNITEVAYLIANEGRRLMDCDRLSVAVRYGKKVSVEAVSGVDIVERRSKQVRRLQYLCRRVLEWGEKLVFRGVPDESIPPKVVEALDAYLEESTSKLLIVSPLRDPREEESKKPARSVIVMESFDPPASVEQMLGRLEVIGKHATRSLYNATEYQRIPMRWVWRPLAVVQEGLGGKARAITLGIVAGVAALIAAMVLVPYPLKMEAKGQLLPHERRWVFSPVEARIVRILDNIRPNTHVVRNQPLIEMWDIDLDKRISTLKAEIQAADDKIASFEFQLNSAQTEADRKRISADSDEQRDVRNAKTAELNRILERTHADVSRPGYFNVLSPMDGTILNADFKETLTDRAVRPSEQLLRIGDLSKPWEIEMKIPQKHIGQVQRAFPDNDPNAVLDVDLLVMSQPTRTYRGKLYRNKIAPEAVVSREEGSTESDAFVTAWVSIDDKDIPEADRLPKNVLTAGTEIHAKIRCGNRALGYSLFYGVWEWFYEKIVFLF
jgi:hypothetical protein